MSLDNYKHDVFISYSTKNSDVANKICHVLEQNNLKCWIAPRNIASGKISEKLQSKVDSFSLLS